MKLFRLALGTGVAGLLAVGLSGCLAEPSFSTTPDISFDSGDASAIKLIHIPNPNQSRDSVSITIHFQDGDGDLGLSPTETGVAPYTGRFANNYFLEPYVKDATGKFVRLADIPSRNIAAGSYNSYFPHVSASTDSHALPLKGTLTWGFPFLYLSTFLPGEEVQFHISIADRALHESNTITTTSVIFPK